MRNHKNRAAMKSGATITRLGSCLLALLLLLPSVARIESTPERFETAFDQSIVETAQASAQTGETPAPETPATTAPEATETAAPQPAAQAPEATAQPVLDPVTLLYQAIDAQGYAYVANANNNVNVFADAQEETVCGTVGSGTMVAVGYDEQRGMLHVLFDASGTVEGWVRVGNVIALSAEQVQANWEREPLVTLSSNGTTFAVETLAYRAKNQPEATQPPEDTPTAQPETAATQAPAASPTDAAPAQGETAEPSSLDDGSNAGDSPAASQPPVSSLADTADAQLTQAQITAAPDGSAMPPSSLAEAADGVTADTATPPSSLEDTTSVPPAVTDTPATVDTPAVTDTPVIADTPAVTATPATVEPSAVTDTPAIAQSPAVAATPATAGTAPVEIVAFQLDGLTLSCTVPTGTAAAALPLPQSLTGVTLDGATCAVPVTWAQAADPAAPADGSATAANGPFTYAAQVAQGYLYTGAPVTAQVSFAVEVAAFAADTAALQYEVAYGTAPADFPLPATLPATGADGAALTVPITWVAQTAVVATDATAADAQPADATATDTQPADAAATETQPADPATADPQTTLPYGSGPWVYTLQAGNGYVYNGEPLTATVAYPTQAAQLTLTGVTLGYEVPRGTAPADLPLPKTLPAVSAKGTPFNLPVVWVNGAATTAVPLADAAAPADAAQADANAAAMAEPGTDYLAGSRYGYGPWVFTAQPAPGYTYTGEAVTAQVWYPDCTTVNSYYGISKDGLLIKFVIHQGEQVNFGDYTCAIMADGGNKLVPVAWSGSYQTNTPGQYAMRMTLRDGFSGPGADGLVVVLPADGE